MVQVTNASFTYSQVLFQPAPDQTATADNPSGGFADMFTGLLKQDSAPLQNEPRMQSISAAVDKLTQSIGTLIKSLEDMMGQLKERLNISLPDGTQLRQTSSAARLEISGTFTGRQKLENAVNNDCFMQQTLQTLHIRYTELCTFSANPETPGSSKPSPADRPFSVTFKAGRATLNTSELSDSLFEKLLEALDSNKESEEKHHATLSVLDETGTGIDREKDLPEIRPDTETKTGQKQSADWI